jgi:hypothetical protein
MSLVFDNKQRVLSAGKDRFLNNEDGLSNLVSEIEEQYTPETLSLESRKHSALNLWRYHPRFSLDQFELSLKNIMSSKESNVNNDTSNEKKKDNNVLSPPFATLNHFFENKVALGGVKHIPKCLEWLKLITMRFSNKLSKAQAREMTIADVLDQVSIDSSERRFMWYEAYQGFEQAWNNNWKLINRIGCTVISDNDSKIVMSPQCCISYCLPSITDEGMYSRALLDHLCVEHNALVESQESWKNVITSSKFFDASQSFQFDLDQDILQYIAKHCVTSSGTYDFSKAQTRIIHLLRNCPTIYLELNSFSYAHETWGNSNDGDLARFKNKVKQEDLDRELIKRIKLELSSVAEAANILEKLEIAYKILAATGGNFVSELDTSVGNMTLCDYLKHTLRYENPETILGVLLSSEQVQAISLHLSLSLLFKYSCCLNI